MTTTEAHTRQPMRAEQTRARYPDESGYVERDGVKLYWEVYGSGEQTVFLLPTWSIIHSRHWKMQIPYLARHCRVLTFDGRGNGRSDRPESGYSEREFAADALAVMDATETERAALVSLSLGAQRALLLAAEQPERIEGAVFIGPSVPLGERPEARAIVGAWDKELDSDEGWAKYNRYYWLKDYKGFLEFFFSQMFNEPHSTKPIEDCVGWGLETSAETLVATEAFGKDLDAETTRELAGRLRCPVLVIQGSQDAITGPDRGVALAEATGGDLVMLEGSGHGPHVRDPVKVNLLLREFLAPARPPARWVRGKSRRKRALYISSPIGLGHAQRDVAIADELRTLHPDLEIDWLAQHPVTRVLEARGERIHPASRHLANESGHIESESAEHDLHCFQAIRRMDEILLANYMVFDDLVREERLRPLDRRRGVGARLLPAREPRAEARRLRVAHRLRRLAADGRRRRARVVPHRRLQRGDDRAHRALPAPARPRGVRRQCRRHRPGGLRPRPATDPRVDRGALRLRRLRDRLRPEPASAIAGRSATATTSASASSPSAARAWERTS